MVLSEIDRERGDNYICNNIRLCDHHFEEFYRTRTGYLTKNAVPTLNIGKYLFIFLYKVQCYTDNNNLYANNNTKLIRVEIYRKDLCSAADDKRAVMII